MNAESGTQQRFIWRYTHEYIVRYFDIFLLKEQ